ncbi:hypothetical protein [Hyphomicrobium sp. ghe19]|uniref:hypothetical protein n=1 Tax=Hyphomicrobium sp. ghe19 TaxID=2682968 RepID=UPI0013674F15|nr:hypothetical protein HYPP_02453 [Hyphomicrobium sp. ghe19]
MQLTQKEQQFLAFHEAHPEVYAAFDKFVNEQIARGIQRVSANDAFYDIRRQLGPVLSDGKIKLNSNHSPYYARLWMKNNPEHARIMKTKVLTTKGSKKSDIVDLAV